MPEFDHPGFKPWPGNDPGFPIGDIPRYGGDEFSCWAEASLFVPQNPPHAKTAAARYAGFPRSGKLWFAVECTTDAAGVVTCEWVLRGQHLHFFPAHGESGPGPVLELRLDQATMFGAGIRDTFAAHGPHCDVLRAAWGVNMGQPSCYLSVTHWTRSVREYRATLEGNAREVEKGVWELPPPPDPPPPDPDEPPQPPVPEVEPDPGDGE